MTSWLFGLPRKSIFSTPRAAKTHTYYNAKQGSARAASAMEASVTAPRCADPSTASSAKSPHATEARGTQHTCAAAKSIRRPSPCDEYREAARIRSRYTHTPFRPLWVCARGRARSAITPATPVLPRLPGPLLPCTHEILPVCVPPGRDRGGGHTDDRDDECKVVEVFAQAVELARGRDARAEEIEARHHHE